MLVHNTKYMHLFRSRGLVVLDHDLTVVDLLADLTRVLAIDGASDRHTRAEHLLHGSREVTSIALGAHLLGGLLDIVQGEVAIVDNVLHLLAISGRLLERTHEQRSGGRDNRDGGLAVLHGQQDTNADSPPVLGALGISSAIFLGGSLSGPSFGAS